MPLWFRNRRCLILHSRYDGLRGRSNTITQPDIFLPFGPRKPGTIGGGGKLTSHTPSFRIGGVGAVSRMRTRLHRRSYPWTIAGSGHKRLLIGQASRAAFAVSLTVNEMAFSGQVIVERSMNRSEFL